MYLKGRIALITGSGGKHGIGRAIALKFASMGADVVVSDIKKTLEDLPEDEVATSWKGIEDVAAEITKMGCKSAAIYCDITKEKQVTKMIDDIVNRLGGLHVLVNNARSIIGPDQVPLVELAPSVWDKVMLVNLRGTYLCCKYVAKQMIKQNTGGRIINISSDLGRRGVPNSAAYCTSKFGITGLTQSLAHELASYSITVNAICPGPTDTHRVNYRERALASEEGVTVDVIRERALFEGAKAIPLGRVANPEDVATVAGFLATTNAGYITGQSINVNGGQVMS